MTLRRLLLAMALCACCPALAQIPDDLTEPGQLPPSTGFANPDDISVLLDYRLPHWWSRVWTANVDLDGRALSSRSNTGMWAEENSTNLDLGTNARWEVEGELTHGYFEASMGGNGERAHLGSPSMDRREHSGHSFATFRGGWRRYFTNRWSVTGGGGGSWSYDERIREDVDEETRDFSRSYATYAFVGVNYGRMRNVTPAIRAARLNERLVALGRAPLATADVLRVAEGLTRQSAYSSVFGRPDRRFWADVLSPVTARDGLSPFETYYLAEVLQENVGDRYEGWEIDGSVRIDYEHGMQLESDQEGWTAAPWLAAWWSHNLSLEHQLSANGSVRLQRRDYSNIFFSEATQFDGATAFLQLRYLWALTDRCLWTTTLDANRDYEEIERDDLRTIRRQLDAQLSTACAIYIEDRLSLRHSVSCRYAELGYDGGQSIQRTFNYQLVLSYDLDNTLN
jgi:hypothetical protein